MSNQKGFSKVAIIIILVFVVIAIGFIKYFNLYERVSDKVVPINTKDFGDTGIIVILPKPNQTISSPLKITGYIDDFGDGWEADFGSVELIDGNGKRIAGAQLGVDATDDQGNYKSRPYHFESTLIFRLPQTEIGTLIFYEHTARGDMTEKFKLSVRFDKKMASNVALSINNWETYKNDEYEIKYPPFWMIILNEKSLKLREKNEKYEIELSETNDKLGGELINKNNLISFGIDGIITWKYKEIKEPEEPGNMFNLFGTIKPLSQIYFFPNGEIEYDTDFTHGFSFDGRKNYYLYYFFPEDYYWSLRGLRNFKLNQELVDEMDEIIKTLKFKKQ